MSSLPIQLQELLSFRFYVEIDKEAFGAFTHCKLPELTWKTDEVEEGGLNDWVHQLPKRIGATNIVLSWGLADWEKLFKWYSAAMSMKWADTRREVVIHVQNSYKKTVFSVIAQNCYPISWSNSELDPSSNAAAIETMTLACGHVSFKYNNPSRSSSLLDDRVYEKQTQQAEFKGEWEGDRAYTPQTEAQTFDGNWEFDSSQAYDESKFVGKTPKYSAQTKKQAFRGGKRMNRRSPTKKQKFDGEWEFDHAAREKALADLNADYEKRQKELEKKLEKMAADRKATADKLGEQYEFDHAARDKELADMQKAFEKRRQEVQAQVQQLEQERQEAADKLSQRWQTGQSGKNV